MYPALALIEVRSIARGMVVSDAVVKKAPVVFLLSCPVSPGRYLSCFWGEVGDAQAAYEEGLRVAGEFRVDDLWLPGAHHDLKEVLLGVEGGGPVDSLGIVETATIASALRAADGALKCTPVRILELRLGSGLDGKGYFVLSGTLADVEAAVEAARAPLTPSQWVHCEIIPSPSSDFSDHIW